MAGLKKGKGLSKGLGRGLDTLIPPTEQEIIESATPDQKGNIPIDKIEPNPNQPRKNFDEDALNELTESIKKHGVIDPLILRKKDDYYEIVGGERRWRASKLAGLTEVPAIVREFTDREVAEIGLIDNIQRENLNPIEEAMAFKQLIEEYGLKQDEVAERVSKSRVAITNTLRLLKLDEKVQQMLVDGMITSGHARVLLSLPEEINQVTFAEKVFDEKMSVRDVEKAIKNLNKKKPEKSGKEKDSQLTAVYSEIEERLKNLLGTKVRINFKDENRGAIELEYYSKEQMSELIDKLEA